MDEQNMLGQTLPKAMITQIFKQESISLTINHEHNISYSVYLKDYQSLLPERWLRSQAINTLTSILYEEFLQKCVKAIAYSTINQQQSNQMHKGNFIVQQKGNAIAEYKGNVIVKQNEEKFQCRQFVKVVNPFITTLIQLNQNQDAILMSLEPLHLFSSSTKYLLIPINTNTNQGSHWILLLYINGLYSSNIQQKSQFIIFDSASSNATQTAVQLAQAFQKIIKLIHQKSINIDISIAKNIPYQNNNFDCGIYTIGYCEYVFQEVLEEIQTNEIGKISTQRFSSMNSKYKHLMANSKYIRDKYRGILEKKLLLAWNKT